VQEAIRNAICEIAGNPTLDPWTVRDVWRRLSPEFGISVSQVRRICRDLGFTPGLPVLFVGMQPFTEESPAGPPLYAETEASDPWPGAPARR
jgi:hypothetical protein